MRKPEISLHTYQGIRIDRRALHIVNGQRGVYVKHGDGSASAALPFYI